MAKTLVVYFSKYGTTQKYAELISKKLGGDIYSINNCKQIDPKDYNTIIIGSGIYAGKIKGLEIIINSFNAVKNKKLVLFTCGLADYSKTIYQDAIYSRLKMDFPEKIIESMKIFYLRGGINYKGLSVKHKIMMWIMYKVILRKGTDKVNEEDREFVDTYGKVLDFVDENSITELIKYCEN